MFVFHEFARANLLRRPRPTGYGFATGNLYGETGVMDFGLTPSP